MGFHGVKSLRAGTAERFKSVEDMHKLEGRLKHLTAEEASQISDALDSRLSELMHDIYNLVPHSGYSNELMELDSIGEVFMEATELKYVSPANVKALFKKYNYPLTDKMASDIVALLFDVNNMPVNIFEAKPERVVGFDEIRKVIIPDTSSDTLRKALKEAGINAVEEYRAGDDAARMKIANDVPDAHFPASRRDLTSCGGRMSGSLHRLRRRMPQTRTSAALYATIRSSTARSRAYAKSSVRHSRRLQRPRTAAQTTTLPPRRKTALRYSAINMRVSTENSKATPK